MAQQKEKERKVGPFAIEEAVRALEALTKSVRPLRRDIEAIKRNLKDAQRAALQVPLDRLGRQIQLAEEARPKVEPLLRELTRRAAWVKQMEEHARRLRETMPRMTARDIDRAVHEVRRELYSGGRRGSS